MNTPAATNSWLQYAKSHHLLPLPSIPTAAAPPTTTLPSSLPINTRSGKCIYYYLLIHPIKLPLPASLLKLHSNNKTTTFTTRIQLSFFDLLSKQFFGRTWISHLENSCPIATILNNNNHINIPSHRCYYKSAIHDDHCIGVLEYVLLIESSLMDGSIIEDCYSLGWSQLDLFGRHLSTLTDTHHSALLSSAFPLTDPSPHALPITNLHHAQLTINDPYHSQDEKQKRPILNTPTFHGTPRSLFFIDLGVGFDHSWIKQLNRKSMVQPYELYTCSALQAYQHLFRNEEIIGEFDSIGGMTKIHPETEQQPLSSQIIYGYLPHDPHYLDHPQLTLPRCCLYLQHPTVILPNEYELNLIETLMRVCLDYEHVRIVKRHLNVGIHNGRCYIRQPVSLSLHITQQNNTENTRTNNNRTNANISLAAVSTGSIITAESANSSDGVMLEFDGEYTMSDLCMDTSGNDPLLCIVFELEYDLEWLKKVPLATHPAVKIKTPAAPVSTPAPPTSHTSLVLACSYAVLNSEDVKIGNRQSILLQRGPGSTLQHHTIYGYSNKLEQQRSEPLYVNITMQSTGMTQKQQKHSSSEEEDHKMMMTNDSLANLNIQHAEDPSDSESAHSMLDQQSLSHSDEEHKEQIWEIKDQLQQTHQILLQQQQQLKKLEQQQQLTLEQQQRQQQLQQQQLLLQSQQMQLATAITAAHQQQTATLNQSEKQKEKAEVDDSIDTPIVMTRLQFSHMLQKELSDPKQQTTFSLIFTDYSYSSSNDHSLSNPTSIYFVLQFFNEAVWVSERTPLIRSMMEKWNLTTTSAAQKKKNVESLLIGFPSPVTYTVEISSLCYAQFIHYLISHQLTITVYDADSQFSLGTAVIPLLKLVRHQESMLIRTWKLNVFQTDLQVTHCINSNDDHAVQPRCTGVLGVTIQHMAHRLNEEESVVMAATNKQIIKGVSSNQLLAATSTSPSLMPFAAATTGMISFRRSSPLASAAILTSTSSSANALHHLNKKVNQPSKIKSNRLFSPALSSTTLLPSSSSDISQRSIISKQELTETYRTNSDVDLVAEQHQQSSTLSVAQQTRDQLRMNNTIAAIQQKITQEKIIHPSLGATIYFEMIFTNPYDQCHTFFITIEDPLAFSQIQRDIRIVKQIEERYWFQQQHEFIQNDTTNMTNASMVFVSDEKDSSGNTQSFVLDAHQTVHIPVIFQSFEEHPLARDINVTITSHRRYSTMEDNRALAYMLIHVKPMNTIIDSRLELHHWRGDPLDYQINYKQLIQQMDPVFSTTTNIHSSTISHIHCTHPGITCTYNHPFLLFSAQSSTCNSALLLFYCLFFTDAFQTQLQTVCQLKIHCHEKQALNFNIGKPFIGHLTMPVVESERRVRCIIEQHTDDQDNHSTLLFNGQDGSTNNQLDVTLSPTLNTQVQYRLQSKMPGLRFSLIHLLDISCHSSVGSTPQLLYSWLVSHNAQLPTPNAKFSVNVVVGGVASQKSVEYENGYAIDRVYQFESSNVQLMKVQQPIIVIRGKQMESIPLLFCSPSKLNGSSDSAVVHLFVSDSTGATEEVIEITVNYRQKGADQFTTIINSY